MGWISAGSNGRGGWTCKHHHDLHSGNCPECAKETAEIEQQYRQERATRAAEKAATRAAKSLSLTAARVTDVEDIDDFEAGTVIWRTASEFEGLYPEAHFYNGQVYHHADGIGLDCKIQAATEVRFRKKTINPTSPA